MIPDVMTYLRNAHSDYTEAELEAICEYAFMCFCRLTNQLSLPVTALTPLDRIWIKRACEELIARDIDMAGVLKYSENGYSVEFSADADDGLSAGLKRMLFPVVRGSLDDSD